MASNSRWWKLGRAQTCQACERHRPCYEFQGAGTPAHGYTILCGPCLDMIVHKRHHRGITRRQCLVGLGQVTVGLCLGGLGGYHILRWRYHHKLVAIVTEKEKELLVAWALQRAKNVSPRVIRQMVDAACESKFPRLIMAIIGAETLPKFDPGSVSKAGCWGPMQVNPKVWLDEKDPVFNLIKQRIIKDAKDLFDPTLGVRAGIYVFCHYLELANGDLRETTRRYVGAIHNKKDAELYFDCIQRYLGEIYLSLERAARVTDDDYTGDDDAGV